MRARSRLSDILSLPQCVNHPEQDNETECHHTDNEADGFPFGRGQIHSRIKIPTETPVQKMAMSAITNQIIVFLHYRRVLVLSSLSLL